MKAVQKHIQLSRIFQVIKTQKDLLPETASLFVSNYDIMIKQSGQMAQYPDPGSQAIYFLRAFSIIDVVECP